ncbi:MAG: hypothetical protein JKY22_11030 [Flavobacteriaceae bacterium]|nr:hypothetical protein [Flavobacteriaceae bacterium]
MKSIKVTLAILSMFLLMSCYSVRLKVSNGQAEPQDNEREDALSGLYVRELDTIIKVKTTTDEYPINIRDCESGALHTVEVKSTLGGVLLYVATFGRKRKVKVKYVCLKDPNQ